MDLKKLKEKKDIKKLLEFSIINIDKPSGPTSFWTSQFVKKQLGLTKTSHFGTLDPAVSGVLPIALNRACRLSDYFMHRNKTYVGIMRIHKDNVTDKILDKEIKKFIGKIKQLPPVRSRVKREVREREVKYFRILERDGKEVLFETEVQAGTYIRRICDDIGKEIGGAHMLELRRIKAGIFSETDEKYPSINLYDFEKAVNEYKKGNEEKLRSMLIPAEIVSDIILPIQINKDNLKKILTGKPLMKVDIGEKIENERFSAFVGDKFIGIYRKVEEGDIVARAEFVFN